MFDEIQVIDFIPGIDEIILVFGSGQLPPAASKDSGSQFIF